MGRYVVSLEFVSVDVVDVVARDALVEVEFDRM